MKPELANLYTVVNTGVANDLVLSFSYEWRDTEDGVNVVMKRQKVASVVLSLDDAVQLAGTLNDVTAKVQAQLSEAKRDE